MTVNDPASQQTWILVPKGEPASPAFDAAYLRLKSVISTLTLPHEPRFLDFIGVILCEASDAQIIELRSNPDLGSAIVEGETRAS